MALLGELPYALIQPSARAIGQIYADVTVEEGHRDEVIITQHPVEGGGVITDHAYKRPAELEIKCGFSNSSAGRVGYVQQQYQALLALQLARKPFNVYTGKRRYQNMLVRGLQVITDPHSENILLVSVALQEVILVSVQTTTAGQGGTGTNTAAAGSSPSDQANPASTGAVQNNGNVEAQGVGSQAFAGSFSPGSVGTPDTGLNPSGLGAGAGTTPIDPGFTGGVIQPTAPITGGVPELPEGIPANLSGISPPAPVTMSIPDAPTIGGLQGAGPDQYNMFGGGP
ncbi:phage baseplate protein [Methylobacterium sp. B1]|uniref:phage baseplate protein n=1 Tax=Methylobacterium sp. B1 TaxID=91459 RepID=UPI000349DD57|nr:hypothetical protein [Methylobacterium sp. B1]